MYVAASSLGYGHGSLRITLSRFVSASVAVLNSAPVFALALLISDVACTVPTERSALSAVVRVMLSVTEATMATLAAARRPMTPRRERIAMMVAVVE